MKAIGVDYGEKKIGIAVSNDDGTLAMPREVIASTKHAAAHVAGLAASEEAVHVVVGESRGHGGAANPVHEKARAFAAALQAHTAASVLFEPEFYTTVQAQKIQGRHDKLDASAAALILQTFLDKHAPRESSG